MANIVDRLTEPYRLAVESWYNGTVQHYFNDSHLAAESWVSVFITVVLYWLLGALFTIVDFTGKPRFLLRYKLHNNVQINCKHLGKLVKQVIRNQILGVVLGFGILYVKHTLAFGNPNVPTISRFVMEWTMFVVIREVFFYYSHRLLHHPSLYRHIHKRHHEWQIPIAIVAIYCHPLEHIISNILPVMIGPFIFNSHMMTFFLWELYVIVMTLSDHCGYHFPLMLPCVFHDFHHLKFNVNYGILGVLDWLHGTDKLFRKSKYFPLNRMYFSVFPPKELASVKEE